MDRKPLLPLFEATSPQEVEALLKKFEHLGFDFSTSGVPRAFALLHSKAQDALTVATEDVDVQRFLEGSNGGIVLSLTSGDEGKNLAGTRVNIQPFKLTRKTDVVEEVGSVATPAR